LIFILTVLKNLLKILKVSC